MKQAGGHNFVPFSFLFSLFSPCCAAQQSMKGNRSGMLKDGVSRGETLIDRIGGRSAGGYEHEHLFLVSRAKHWVAKP